MREYEMRQRVFRFLKARMRNMIMPATVGLGLAVGGCAREGTVTGTDAAQMQKDTPSATSEVLGPDSATPGPDQAVADSPEAQANRDAVADLGREPGREAVPVYGSDVSLPDLRKDDGPDAATSDAAPPTDQAVALDVGGIDVGKADGPKADGNSDLGSIITKYIAPIPDAASDTGVAPVYIAPVYIAPVYSALTPDASVPADGLAVRYMAQQPDSASVVAVYSASQPS